MAIDLNSLPSRSEPTPRVSPVGSSRTSDGKPSPKNFYRKGDTNHGKTMEKRWKNDGNPHHQHPGHFLFESLNNIC